MGLGHPRVELGINGDVSGMKVYSGVRLKDLPGVSSITARPESVLLQGTRWRR